MPLMKPKKGQTVKGFIALCMSNKKMKAEFPKSRRRLAVCHSQSRKGK